MYLVGNETGLLWEKAKNCLSPWVLRQQGYVIATFQLSENQRASGLKRTLVAAVCAAGQRSINCT